MRAQIEQVGENIKTCLEAAGATLADIVKTDTYVTDYEEFAKHPDMRMRYFGPATPTSTTVQISRLADPDAMIEIDEAKAEPEAPSAAAAPKPVWHLFPWIATAVLALALPAISLLRPKSEARMLQLEVSAPPGHTFGTTNLFRYAISPDGSKLAFVATSADGNRSLWVRPLDAIEAIRLAGTEGATCPFWDPASRWIAFFANGKLQKIDVRGGQPQVLCDAALGVFGTWSRDGVILFSDPSLSLRRVSAGGGASQVLPLDESRKETSQRAPQFLPDGRRFLYASWASRGASPWVPSTAKAGS